MRVLLVNKFHYRKGGAETYYFTIGHELERMGHDVAYFSMKHPQNVPCAQEKFFVTQREYNNVKNPYTAARDGMALIYSREAKRNFQALCEEFKPDVVHLNNVHRQITLSILDAPYLKDHRVPVVYTAHDYVTICPAYTMLDGSGSVCDRCVADGHFCHCIENSCVKGSKVKSALASFEASFLRSHHSYEMIDCVIAPSEFMRDKLIEGGWDVSKVVTLRNFATDELMSASAQLLDSSCKLRRFLFFGRLSHEKGVGVFLAAFKEKLKELDGWSVLIAGDGPERDDLKQFVAENGLNHRVEFCGYKQGNELQKIISRSAFSVLGSVWRENMPYSIIESLAFGTPVIGANIGGIPELVVDGKTGYTCEPDNVASMAAAPLRADECWNTPHDYSQMIRHCRDVVSEKCDEGSYMELLTAIYERLIHG